MSDKLSKAREMLAGQILEDFKGKITGNKIDYVVGDNPENIFFVVNYCQIKTMVVQDILLMFL